MLPKLITPVPGPVSRKLARKLARYESPNVTFMGPPGPIIWKRASGCNVWDADGNRYLDLTSAFGVAGLGHTARPIQAVLRRQSTRLLHGMGDVHPTELKIDLLEQLSEITFERWTRGRTSGQTVLGNSGFEAVEIALKTAFLKTGRNRILAFGGAYHGVGFGALQATWRKDFRAPFAAQLRQLTTFLPYPRQSRDLADLERRLRKLLRGGEFGAMLVEPVQARGGIVCPPVGFLRMLRRHASKSGALLIVDEIFTGFWRTGRMFAVEHSGVVPDLICLGKALTGALPLSACVAKKSVMKSWPKSRGESIHTTTFLGNPLACAAALASIRAWRSPSWKRRLGSIEKTLRNMLAGRRRVRGMGAMFGVELAPGRAVRVCETLLRRGIIALAEGERGEVLAMTPPLTISKMELRFAAAQLREAIDETA